MESPGPEQASTNGAVYSTSMRYLGRIPGSVRRLDWMDRWNQLAGYARIEAYDPKKGARYYLGKYVVKGGEIDLGGPLEDPPLFDLRPGCWGLPSRRGRTGEGA